MFVGGRYLVNFTSSKLRILWFANFCLRSSQYNVITLYSPKDLRLRHDTGRLTSHCHRVRRRWFRESLQCIYASSWFLSVVQATSPRTFVPKSLNSSVHLMSVPPFLSRASSSDPVSGRVPSRRRNFGVSGDMMPRLSIDYMAAYHLSSVAWIVVESVARSRASWPWADSCDGMVPEHATNR